MVETLPVRSSQTPTQRGQSERSNGSEPGAALTPASVVEELDKYIIGQVDAKRAVAVALRNRYRRAQLPEMLRQEIQPRNILMIGPTGVGKTEIARRVAKMVGAPFVKVEATKFTEVGYVGRDVESIIRDLVEVTISQLHSQRLEQVAETASDLAVERLADIVVEQRAATSRRKPRSNGAETGEESPEDAAVEHRRRQQRLRKRMLRMIQEHALDEETIEIELDTDGFGDLAPVELVDDPLGDEFQPNLRDFLDSLVPRRPIRRRVSVREAQRILTQQEAQRLIDIDSVIDEAIELAEEAGVVFLDELDKTISQSGEYGGEVSGEGVQRDLLPIVEGGVVMTRYGPVKTNHILFIAAGAFHTAKPSDLIPELQGRFPIRVELDSLGEDELYRILAEPRNALTKQYQALLDVEGVVLEFPEDGLAEIAAIASQVNTRTEDIGARRLQTILEKVLEDVSFTASDRSGETIIIDRDFVKERVGEIAEDDDLSSFIL